MQNEKMTLQQSYDAIPPQIKVSMLERECFLMSKLIKEVHLNIQNFQLMKKGSMAYEDFYKIYNQLVIRNK